MKHTQLTKFISLSVFLLVIGFDTLSAQDRVLDAATGIRQSTPPASLSLSLQEAQKYAVERNRSLRNASLAVQEAYAQRWQTIAAMMPQVDGSIGKNIMYDEDFNEKKIQLGTPTPMSMSPWVYGITASAGLNGQGIVGALLNNIAIDMKNLSLEQSETELRANVRTSYMTVLVLRDISQLLDSSLANIEKLASMTQIAVNAGAAEQTTADQIKVRINTMKNNINSNRRNAELAMNTLRVLLAVPAETQITLTQELSQMLSAETILNQLSENFNIHNNLNYQLLEKSTELAKRNVHMAGWAYGPTVSAFYQYNYRDYGKEEGFSMMNSPHTVGFSVSMPLWSSGKRAAGVVEKKIAYEEAKNTLAETTDQLGIQYQQLRFNLNNAYETYLNEKENIEVTKRVFNSATEKFRWGTASNLELTNAGNDLISAQSSYVQAVLTLVNAQVELDKFLNNK